jgi:hypothetical protein
MFLTVVTAQTIQTLEEFDRGKDIRLIQAHPNATYINITEVLNPSKEVVLSNVEMNKNGNSYYYVINASINENWELGKYLVRGVSDGDPFIFVYDFELVQGGRWALNFNNINFLVGFILLCIVVIGLLVYKQYMIGGSLIAVIGFILFFSEVVWYIPVIIILVGVGVVAKGEDK